VTAPQQDMCGYAILTLRSMLCQQLVQSMSLPCKHLRRSHRGHYKCCIGIWTSLRAHWGIKDAHIVIGTERQCGAQVVGAVSTVDDPPKPWLLPKRLQLLSLQAPVSCQRTPV